MMRGMSWGWSLLLLALVAASQTTTESIERFRARLVEKAELSPEDRVRLIDESARAMAGRVARMQDGALTHDLDEKSRAAIFAILTGRLPVDDAGMRAGDGRTLRGLRAPATPVQSEVDATETLWIDTDTLLPRRFEFTYSMPGFGDAAFDLIFER